MRNNNETRFREVMYPDSNGNFPRRCAEGYHHISGDRIRLASGQTIEFLDSLDKKIRWLNNKTIEINIGGCWTQVFTIGETCSLADIDGDKVVSIGHFSRLEKI